ncbi:hypothetical protein ACWT_2048 [Actinoplanes sp. SE50]|uniref:hypothetical protein n=1 Tax=unclassified Actinoplanes TaxID=2626549 RepID=UPI00023EC5B2|nr:MULTISPECIES: hypothetical protein [unclassified Actinoplanes]AEV83067.1 hypothetical protein ACPL_2170 [Actinoplanes sp. SE50/110]ATO81463.1 hypothetical protein ACWT_2048 [Actinoplanes sp. SE50]SLL98870.1 hypothetical protein ACSP50_2097 [Actinoplanes sp. SE50/110]
MTRSVTTENLGAWLLKGNADTADLAGRFAREPRVERWCVRPGYRLDLMRAGQPVLFWASGSRRRDLPYGIWGWGRLRGPARRGGPEAGWWVPLDLVIAEPGRRLRRDELRGDPVLAGLEVLRQPQGSNPSFVTGAELAAIRRRWISDDR